MVTRSGPMSRAVTSALQDAKPAARDAGAVALAKQYAALIDEAAPAGKYRKALDALERVAAASDDDGAAEMLRTISTALAEHSVASDLGPKLLAALTALGLTLAGRPAVKGGGPVVGTPKRDELKERRRARADRAAAVHSAAP